ncbi:MAG: hypothetical protein Q3M24_06580 [Candidatus Electrothrix aestuarii]|uniref:Uncharacterized protein n=1 Tax=Candidatus Electrothrix aestuarii TaxID=3062594 RepID=A0AAU8LYW3_9BACT|nr:hypothetical protein [Candidatus Electrothrix aestuarii]
MLKKISPLLPALISSSAILCATFFSQSATKMLNDSIQEMTGGVLPIATTLALTCFEYYLLPGVAALTLCIISWTEWKVQDRPKRLAVQVYLLAAFLLLTTVLFAATAIPFACFCDTL